MEENKLLSVRSDGSYSYGGKLANPGLVFLCTRSLSCFYFVHVLGIAYTLVVLLGEVCWLPDDEMDWCYAAQRGYPRKEYPNPDYNNNPCFKERTPYLLFLNQMECDFTRRMLYSVLLGGMIGYERRKKDRPAGIRTMSLVCLGACFFTMCSQMAFRSSTMEWDAARVSAAIPSGVGFLGAGLIWKGAIGEGTDKKQEVHGLTTAASVWLSASVGVGTGGRLYVISTYAVFLIVFVLRLGPSMVLSGDRSYFDYAESPSESDWDESERSGDADEEYERDEADVRAENEVDATAVIQGRTSVVENEFPSAFQNVPVSTQPLAPPRQLSEGMSSLSTTSMSLKQQRQQLDVATPRSPVREASWAPTSTDAGSITSASLTSFPSDGQLDLLPVFPDLNNTLPPPAGESLEVPPTEQGALRKSKKPRRHAHRRRSLRPPSYAS